MKLLQKANGNIVRTKEEKEKMIAKAAIFYGEFLKALGFDYKEDDNSRDTPTRVAKSFVEDLISGSFEKDPKVTAFKNTDGYTGIICQTNITIRSLCGHHHREIYGKAHIAYIPSEDGKVVGLSKLNRIADFYARRFQLQEALTKQIHDHVNKVCEGNLGVGVLIEATHGCVRCRGIKDSSKMVTSQLSGAFLDNNNRSRNEFYTMITLKPI